MGTPDATSANMGNKNGKPVLRDEDIATLTKSSGLDEAQVKSSFDDFIEKYPDGKIRPKVFHEKLYQNQSKMSVRWRRMCSGCMIQTMMDIDFTEFMTTFLIMADGEPEEVLTKIFRVFDVNGDGSITMTEMTKLTKDMYGMLKAEDPNIAAKEMIAKSAFAEMDKDKDGKVTLDEFINACMGQEEFSRVLTLKLLDIFVE